MRVTEVSKREQVLDNIQKTSSRLQEAQMQMATGKGSTNLPMIQ